MNRLARKIGMRKKMEERKTAKVFKMADAEPDVFYKDSGCG